MNKKLKAFTAIVIIIQLLVPVYLLAHHYSIKKYTEENTEEQIDHILNVVPKVVSYLRDISPVWEALETGEKPHLL